MGVAGSAARVVRGRGCYHVDLACARCAAHVLTMEVEIKRTDGLLARLCDGDRVALAQVTRMVTRRLGRLGAYDLHDDWADVCQQIVWSLVKSARSGRGPSDDKLGAYISQAVWNRYASLLRRRGLRDLDPKDAAAEVDAEATAADDDRLDIDRVYARQAFARLPRPTQQLLWARYVEGRTVDSLSERSGRSRASVNRDLADARAEFATLLGLAKASTPAREWAPRDEIDATIRSGSDEVDQS